MNRNAAGMGPALQWAAMAAGIVWAWSGFKGRSPWAEVVGVLRGSPVAQVTPARSDPTGATIGVGGSGTNALAAGVKKATSPCCGGPAVALVQIPNHPGFRLRADAAASLTAVERKIGRTVQMSGAHRTCAAQTAAHALDPHRFANPCSSGHPQGIAVDIDNKPAADLIAAMTAAGWHRARSDEAWHWSYGVSI